MQILFLGKFIVMFVENIDKNNGGGMWEMNISKNKRRIEKMH